MTRIPVIGLGQAWDSPAVDTWRETLRRRIESGRLNVWSTPAQVPQAPQAGDAGVVTFAATSGPGLYFHDGTQWHIVNTTVTVLP